MEKDRWAAIQAIFVAALEKPAGEREPFLREKCGADHALYNEVCTLLAAHDKPHSLLDGHALQAVNPTESLRLEGSRVGPYRIVEHVGSGGMGTVYKAERADGQFEQTVALKLIKRGMDTEAILQRFHSERQILAQLDHPNIARLLDGGLTEDGLPYFTMEYVDGEPIDRYCDTRRLSIGDRVALFRTACDAVQYAHTKLVVHRDLKPNNILVTGDSTVKLLDFGIAKMLDDESAEGLTRTGARFMTPAYASPEQIRGESVSTGTDVYSLGVVLYELLCGRRPFPVESSAPADLERLISTTDPDKPSRAAVTHSGGTATPEAVAHARRLHTGQIQRRLAGDLDNICLTALHKDPDRRYGSAHQLSEDLGRHAHNLPVSARPDTVGYRFRKFAARNRAALSTSVVVIALITSIVVFYTMKLTSERNRAQLESAKAERVSEFMASLFEAAAPNQSKGEEVTVREMLDRGATRIREELADQPEVQAKMLNVVGDVYQTLGLYGEARPLIESALTIRRELHGDEHLDVIESLNSLMVLQYDTGQADTAMTTVRRILALRRKLLGNDHPDVALSLNDLAWLLYEKDSLDVAESYNREALRIRERHFGPEHRTTMESTSNLAAVLHQAGKYEEAEQMYRRVLEVRRRILGVHTETGYALNNLASLLEQMRKFDEAEPLYREALDINTKLLGADHPDLSTPLINLGRLLSRMGEFKESEVFLRRAIAIDEQRGPAHPYVAYDLNELGKMMHKKGDYDASEEAFQRALLIYQQAEGQGPTSVANVKQAWAVMLIDKGEPERAEPMLRESRDLWLAGLGADHWRIGAADVAMGRCLAAQGRYDEAEVLLERGYKTLVTLRGEDDARTQEAAGYLDNLRSR